MTNIDQFESVFRAADKEAYVHQPVRVDKILQITDLDPAEAASFHERLRCFLAVLGDDPAWTEATLQDFADLPGLLKLVEREAPDLVVTYRNLGSEAWRWPYSLGETLDVLTQATAVPVMVLPHPQAGRAYEHALENTDVVMAITDHLAGDSTLVDHAAHYTQKGGKLLLTHIEDQIAHDRMMEVIGKIPAIDTETARTTIHERLLKEPRDYIETCRRAIAEAGIDLVTEGEVLMGHELHDHRRFVEEHAVDLVVFHTKDHGQLAMHGRAYALAVDLREVPVLML